MNSITRPRKRPRQRSISFRTFFWVLRREAALRIMFAQSIGTASERPAREAVVKGGSDRIVRACEQIIRLQHFRRHFPRSA